MARGKALTYAASLTIPNGRSSSRVSDGLDLRELGRRAREDRDIEAIAD